MRCRISRGEGRRDDGGRMTAMGVLRVEKERASNSG